MAETVLVTGAFGFVGSELVKKLIDKNYRVIGVDNNKSAFLDKCYLSNENFIFKQIDLNNETVAVLQEYPIKYIFHLASRQPSKGIKTFSDFYKGNIGTTEAILRLSELKDIDLILYTSTINVLGKSLSHKLLHEELVPVPVDYYSITKYVSEKLLEIHSLQCKTKISVVRFPSLIGRNHLGGFIYDVFTTLSKNEKFEIYNNGEQIRSFLHVNDAVNILVRHLEKYKELDNYNVFHTANSGSLSSFEIARIIKDKIDSDADIIKVPKKTSLHWDINIDISKLKNVLEYIPENLKETINRYIIEMQ